MCDCGETPIGGCVNSQKIPRSAHRCTGTLDRTPFNDRLSQVKGQECKAQAFLNSLNNRRLGNGLTHGKKILTKILNSSCF